ncbi:MAG: hypothetical protein RL516_2011 [Bacteroidota bacterium]|jgi:hypothetical protein
MKKVYISFLFAILRIAVCAQPTIQWQKCLGGISPDYAFSIQQTTDWGYVLTGFTYSNSGDVSGNHGLYDVWVVKLDGVGNIQWQKCLGGSQYDCAYSIQQTVDGGFILTGFAQSYDGDISGNHGLSDVWVVKLDGVGNIQWQKCLGGTESDYGYSIQQTTDGGYVLTGYTESNDGDVVGNHGGRDVWVVKLDSIGNIQWQKCFGGTFWDEAYSIQQTADGGYIVTGYTKSNNGDVGGYHGGQGDFWVVKIGSLGAMQWQKCLGGTDGEVARSIQQTIDGGFILTGFSKSFDGDVSGNYGDQDVWVVKLNNLGNIQWEKNYGGTSLENSLFIQKTTDGGYIITGVTASNNIDVNGNHGGFNDIWVLKLDSIGYIQWQKCLGGTNIDIAWCIQQTNDGGYILTGGSDSNDGDVSGNHGGSTPRDFWVVKLSSTVGMNEFSSIKSLNIFPNPTSGILNIESNELLKRIELFDMLGKLVLSYGNEKQIDISNLQSGLYLIRFTSENGVEQRRVEVNR